MTHFVKQGATWAVTESANLDIHSRLPVGTYVVQFHPEKGYYLNEMDDMTVPDKVYGSLPNYADRIISTFQKRTVNTGVLLVGDKGSGKTMLGRKISKAALALDIPTIVINAPWTGDGFNKFMQNIHQEVVIILDEFEKVYKNHPHEDVNPQEHMLTLLDGVFTSKKLFVLTCNDPWKIDEHMRNRPGRLFYRIDFKGMEEAAIREYCADVLKTKEWTEQIIKISQAFYSFNFDMLKALVEECNRYDEEPKAAIRLMNMTPESSGESYECHVTYKGEALLPDYVAADYFEGSPLAQNEMLIRINVPAGNAPSSNAANSTGGRHRSLRKYGAISVESLLAEETMSEDKVVENRTWVSLKFSGATPKSTAGGIFVYEPSKDIMVTFTKRPVKTFNFDAF